MKYALLIYSAPDTNERPYAEAREAWVDYARAVKEAGILLGAEQLAETDTATSVRVRGGQRLLTDGPFLETKEHLGGYYLLECTEQEALEAAAKLPDVRFGAVEVHEVMAVQEPGGGS